MKTAQYGTAIVVMHVIAHGLHGLAHQEIPVSLSLLQGLFVGVVVTLAPLLQPVYSGRRSTASVAGSCWVQSQAHSFCNLQSSLGH